MKALELNIIFLLYDPLLTIILATAYLIDGVILIKANGIYTKDQHNNLASVDLFLLLSSSNWTPARSLITRARPSTAKLSSMVNKLD